MQISQSVPLLLLTPMQSKGKLFVVFYKKDHTAVGFPFKSYFCSLVAYIDLKPVPQISQAPLFPQTPCWKPTR